MTLSVNVKNWLQTSQSNNTLTLDLSRTNVPNIDLANSLNDQSVLECYGYDCIVELDPIGYRNTVTNLPLGELYYITDLVNSKFMFRLLILENGLLSLPTFNNILAIFSKNSLSKTVRDNQLTIKYQAHDSVLPLFLSGINTSYSVGTNVVMKVYIMDPIANIPTGTDTTFTWSCFTSSGSLVSSSLYQRGNGNFTSGQLPEGTFTVNVIVKTAYGEGTISGNFSIVTASNLPRVWFHLIPSIVPVTNDLVVSCDWDQTIDSISWNLSEGRLRDLTPFNITTGTSSSRIHIDKASLFDGEYYTFNVTITRNGISNIATLRLLTDIRSRIYCNALATGNGLIFEDYLSVSCTIADSSIVKYNIEVHSQGKRLFILSNTAKNYLVTRLPNLSNSFIIMKGFNKLGSFGLSNKTVDSTLVGNTDLASLIMLYYYQYLHT